MNHNQHYFDNGYIYIRKQRGELLASKILKETKHIIKENKNSNDWEEISGPYYQLNIEKYQETWQKMIEYAKNNMIEQGGLDREFVKDLQAKHFKLLNAPPGTEAQFAHLDGTRSDCFVVAYYVTPDVRSTELTTAPYIAKDYNDFTDAEMVEFGNDARWDSFSSQMTKAGDLCIFSENTVHRGPQNSTLKDRYVVFFMLIPSRLYQDHSDEIQIFEMNWANDTFSKTSQSYRQIKKKYTNTSIDLHIADN
jgi:hypothetical protein